jgi:hypothetical protein
MRLHPAGPPECGTFVAPERHARSSTNDCIISRVFSWFPPPPPYFRDIEGLLGFRGRGRGEGGCRRVGGVGVGVGVATSSNAADDVGGGVGVGVTSAAAGVTFTVTVGGGVGGDALELAPSGHVLC